MNPFAMFMLIYNDSYVFYCYTVYTKVSIKVSYKIYINNL